MENRTLEATSFIPIYPHKLKSVPRSSGAGRASLGQPWPDDIVCLILPLSAATRPLGRRRPKVRFTGISKVAVVEDGLGLALFRDSVRNCGGVGLDPRWGLCTKA